MGFCEKRALMTHAQSEVLSGGFTGKPGESPPTPLGSVEQAGKTFLRMFAHSLALGIPLCVLTLRFRFMTRMRQPLQVVKTVIVSRDDVIAIRADSITFGNVLLRLAQAVSPRPDQRPALGPVVRQPRTSVARVPVSSLPAVSHAPHMSVGP